jgi:hypothetical protein
MTEWDCDAYGPEGTAVGALCFLALHGRLCASEERCRETMASMRLSVHVKLGELAREGDEIAEFLLAEFPTPDELLGGQPRLKPPGEPLF